MNPQTQAVLLAFSQQPGVTPDQATNLLAIISSSPALTAQMDAAVVGGHLKGFEPLPVGTHAGGEYRPGSRTIRLPLAMLTTMAGTPIDMAEPAFVLGHELQHGFNRIAVKAANENLIRELEAEARQPATVHDYTPAIAKRIAVNRTDEASAEISGWNALVGLLKNGNPRLTLGDIYESNKHRMADFIDKDGSVPPNYSLKPNLVPDPDLSISPTPANIEAMGTNYFDKAAKAFGGPVGLGQLGNSDYANYYGASAISVAAQIDTRDARPYHGVQPRMVIDMQRLGLDESLLEENGLVIGGGKPSPKAYYDGSQASATLHHFDQTWQTHAYVPIAPGGGAASRPRSPDDPSHPEHALLEQIRSGIRWTTRPAAATTRPASGSAAACWRNAGASILRSRWTASTTSCSASTGAMSSRCGAGWKIRRTTACTSRSSRRCGRR